MVRNLGIKGCKVVIDVCSTVSPLTPVFVFVCVWYRWQADSPDRCLRRSLWKGCGLSGGTGLNAPRPAGWVCHRGAGSVYLLHLLTLLLTPSPHLTGQVIIQGASEVLSTHLCNPSTLLDTMGNTHLFMPPPSPPITTQDCHCTGIPTLEEEGLPYRDKPIPYLLFTRQNSPKPIKIKYLFIDLPTILLHTATASQRGSSGGQPIQQQWGLEEAGAEGRSPPVVRLCLGGGELNRKMWKKTNHLKHN